MSYYRFVRVEYIGKYKEKSKYGYLAESYRNAIYLWDHGHIVRYMKKGARLVFEEMAYIHLQKRKMLFSSDLLLNDVVKIIPNCFCELEYPIITLDNFDKIKKWDSQMEIAGSFIRRNLIKIKEKIDLWKK